ncbi:MAG: DnaD domain protein [Eubacteriales bacterium]|nr:DnaD domain protein [Eubacteriales bacterium]
MRGYYLAGNKPTATGKDVILPRLFGTLALLRATADDLRVLLSIAQSEPDDDMQSIAVACDLTTEQVQSSVSFWKKYRIIKEHTANEESEVRKKDSSAEASENEHKYGSAETSENEHKYGSAEASEAEHKYGSVADKLGYDEKKFAEEMYLIAEKIEKPDANFSESEKEELRSLLSSYDFEYVLVMAKYYYDIKGHKFHIAYLRDAAKSNEQLGITTAEEFIEYTAKKDSIEYAARRLFGLGTTSFSSNQKKYIDKWSSEYKYDKDVFGFAYDIMADKSQRRTFKYIDTLLTKWHNNGCRTIDDVQKFHADDEAKWHNSQAVRRDPKKPSLKNASFDVKDAFKKALERSNRMLEYTAKSTDAKATSGEKEIK